MLKNIKYTYIFYNRFTSGHMLKKHGWRNNWKDPHKTVNYCYLRNKFYKLRE